MLIGKKDIFKTLGISVISFCAVFVCTLFLNFNIDITKSEHLITSEYQTQFYEVIKLTGKVVCYLCGGCLFLTSALMLLFFIKNYIDSHKKELGILKALGYSNFNTAKRFMPFGLSVFIGTLLGFTVAFIFMPLFYEIQNEDGLLPDISVSFNPSVLFILVILPTVLFSLLSVLFALKNLKIPVIYLIKEKENIKIKHTVHKKQGKTDRPFLKELARNTVKSRKSLIFFIFFASFCYSSMMQMSFSMTELSSVMMSVIMLLIGILLSAATIFLSLTSVLKANSKTIELMRIFGYEKRDGQKAMLGVYRIAAYPGFAVGTAYQYGLLKIMVSVVFKDIENVPEYNFGFNAMLICLASFILIYESTVYFYSRKIAKVPIKQIMAE